ncbi:MULTISPECIES: hypothetical protein [Corallococcus]|uniref:hypothetical protein n=1 Tax=Corallococcus TaxID=83461 RepID=UPI00117E94B8|nr:MULTISPECIES: hypothetical protein [Corallococcus]NBD08989.1 hypothetical protein [Corallococcus silvisoli]TSC32926.1 hypothetical protein FOF48_08000 [Corallococcus sp. Z5C101001]
MAAPREVPIILGLFVTLAALMAHVVADRLDRTSARPEGPRAARLEPGARAPTPVDLLAMVGVGVLGVGGVTVQALGRRARLLDALGAGASSPRRLPAPERRMLARRTGLVLGEWVCFAALSFGFMLRRPPGEWLLFLVPCVLLVLPARVYVRYRDGEAMWAPWLLAFAVLALGATRAPKSTWGLLLIVGVCQVCVLRQEHAERVRRRAEALGDSGGDPSR